MTNDENKYALLAERLADFLKPNARLIIRIPTDPPTISIAVDFLPKLLPELTKEELAQGFLALEKRGVLKYENWKANYRDNYDEIKFFDVQVFADPLSQFIAVSKNDVFGFRLANREYRKGAVDILKRLSLSGANAFGITEFEEEHAYDILERIKDFSGAISIKEKMEADYDRGDDGEIFVSDAHYVPSMVEVKNKGKLKEMLNKLERTIMEVYEQGIGKFLSGNQKFEWRCKKCSRWLATLSTRKEIEDWLDKIYGGKYMPCHKCRARNIFFVSSEGEISRGLIEKSAVNNRG